MNWDEDYKLIMRDLGVEPYGCLAKGCSHVSRTFFGTLIHFKFGDHNA